MSGKSPLWVLSASLLLCLMPLNNAETLTPPYFNLAEGRKITASSTCGQDIDGPELYCKLVGSHTDDQQNQTFVDDPSFLKGGHVVIQGQQCDYCTTDSHPVEYAIDGTEKWWQSPPLSRGMKYNEVNLTIDFGQEFHVAYIFIRMGNSPRPGLWTLEKSSDYGKTWTPWQHFSDSETDCEIYFGRESLKPITKDDDVICTTEFSKIVPLESGEIIVRLLNSRPSANNYFNSTVLQEWSRATNIRIRLLRTKNLLGHLMSVARQDPTVTRRYFYSIKDISIGGRCVCNGHANTCVLDPRSRESNIRLLACSCQHNTCGTQCETCCEGFEQKKWRQNTNAHPFRCEPCNCHGHSNKCHYDEEVDMRGESLDIHGRYEGGGVCENCQHNTEGINCNKCKSQFYRPYGKYWNETDVCQPCNCNYFYSTGNCEEESGRCECRTEFKAPNCDTCSEGHFGYPNCRPCECYSNGTDGEHCEATDGKCPCKPNFGGDFCKECAPGYFNFPECKPCNCNEIGSDGETCDEQTGQCLCKPNYAGLKCDQCKDGNYDYPSCDYCLCDIHGTEPEICNKITGECLCKEGYGSTKCDRCISGFYNYPNCIPCNCSLAGSVQAICDANGKCPCLQNFAGKRCDQCMAGFYQFPECLPCNCDNHGSIGISCNNEGQCNCDSNFDGKTCNTCKENFYNYPLCESCDCNPAGVIAKFAGCGSVPAGELCECKERVQGRICDDCRPLYWNLNVTNPDGCEDCDCLTDGTIGALDTCETKSGQCSCKSFVGGRRCDECVDGTFDLFGSSLFGCKPCGCDIGGSSSPVCNKVSGECRCHPRITSRDCTRPLQLHYYPTLYQLKYEYEDGATSTGAQVRYQFDEDVFPDFSKIGYAVFSQLQNEITNEVNIQKSSFYRLIIRYVNPGPEPVVAEISVQSENTINPDQDGKIVFKPNKHPDFVTMSGKGDVPTPIVLDPGKYNIVIKTNQPLFLDYFVLLPAAYYEASILTRNVINPCKIDTTSGLCRLYRYPSIESYNPVYNAQVTKNGKNINAGEFYRNYEHLSAINENEPFPIITPSQNELIYTVNVGKAGRYVLIIDYVTDPSFSDAAFVSINQQDEQDQDGIALIYPCTYASMICRGPILDKESREKVFFIDDQDESLFIINGDSVQGVAIKSLTVIPYDQWSTDFIQPQAVCVLKNGACVEASYIPAPNSKKIEFETDQEERVAVENLPSFSSNGTKTVFINADSQSVQLSSKVHEPARYVIMVQYYQPNHPKFNIIYRLQTENQNYDGKFTLKHCPSTSGCRDVIQLNDDYAWFDIEDQFTISFTNLNQNGVWLDYLILVPVEYYQSHLLVEEEFDQTNEFLKECGQDHFNVQLNASDFCKSSVFSLTSDYNVGALPCNCDIDGSKSFECEPFGGQCQCKANIVGRMCDVCKTGYYGFPDCKPCDCPSTAICEKRTGECICPPRVTGEKCDQCVPYTFGFDQIIGCEDCNCNPLGVLNGNMQCDLNNGSCICSPNVVGRACEKCAYGFFTFPYCSPCRCDLRGTTLEVCDQDDETCFCKKNVEGRECNLCVEGTYNLQEKNPDGCTKCFCFGQTTRCDNAYLRPFDVSMMRNLNLHNIDTKGGKWEKTDWTTTDNILINDTTAHVMLNEVDNPDLLKGFAYFGMLDHFINQNNHLTAYGGYLRYSLFYTTHIFGDALIGPDVILEAKDIRIKHLNYRQPAAGQKFEGIVEMIESNFQSLSGAPVTREQFMTVLRDLTKIYIRAAYFDKTVDSYISDVTLTCADEDPENYNLYKEIPAEKCLCPPGYTGLSCENCAPGYYRDPNGPHGGYCIPCECNGHADTCDCNTGICENCQHHTTGDHCEMCIEGYHGNATNGSPNDCMICSCPLPYDSNNFAYGCEVSPDGYSISCDCKPGYTGHKCQSCANGFYGRPEILGEVCKPCECSGNIDTSMPGSCDSVTGECMHCLNNSFGTACELCAPGYYGDAVLLKDCKSCICDDLGTDHCDSTTGNCVCHQNVVGEKCDRCLDDHFGFESGYGCLPCDCGVASNSTQCDDHTGECACKVGVTGRQCDRCMPGFWDYGPDGCTPCSCNTELSRGLGCNPYTGQCECLRSVVGEKCDSCPPRWVFIENEGCEECDGCHHALLDTTDALHAQLKPVVEELSTVTKSYYTTQKLKRLNEEAEDLKPEVEKLDPNTNNLSEQIQEVDSLEMDTKNHIKKSNYNNEKAMDLKKASADMLKSANEDSSTFKAVTLTVLNTIKEVADLATNLDLDEKNTKLDRAVEEAEHYFDQLKAFNPEITFKPKADQCNSGLVFGDVDKFAAPIKEQKENLDAYKESLEDFNRRIDDLREKSRETQMTSIVIREMNAKNKDSRLKQKLETIANLLKEADDGLKDGKSLKNKSQKLLSELDLSFGDAERLNKELGNLNQDYDKILPKNEDEFRNITLLVQQAFDHAISLGGKKSELENQYSDITANSNDAIKAVGAYTEIEAGVNIARNKSKDAFDDASNALDLLDGISDRAGQSHQTSNDLVHEGRDALSNVQSELSPSLQKSKDDLSAIKQDIDLYTNKLKNMNESVDNINSDPYTELWKLIIKNADEALDLKEVSNATLKPVLENVEKDVEKALKVSKDVEDTSKDVSSAKSQVQKVGELVPGIIGLIDEVDEKNKKIDSLSSQLNTDLERLRRQIDQARNIANSIKLGVSFMPNTTLQLKTPDNIQSQTFNTRVSTYFKRNQNPNGLLLYLGNEQKSSPKPKRADYMAIELENGYPKLLLDLGNGPENIVVPKLVENDTWYEAIVDRKGNDVTFTIREEDNQGNEQIHEQKKTLAGEPTNFRLDENSRLFVGGCSDYNMPKEVNQHYFEGEIEDLKIGDNHIGLWNFVDAENNVLGAVERDRLVAKESKYTGYRFGGNGYVVLDARPFNFKQRSHISFKFKAARDSPNGLLFFVGSEDHYISLELRDGNVVFRFKLGQASQIVEIKTEHLFSDDEWHSVSATRDSGQGVLVVDEHRLYESTLYNSENYRAPEKMYFGGYPDRMFLSGIQTRNFDGCIDDVQIEGTPIDLTRNIESHDVLTGCPQKFSPVVGFAPEKYGYLKLRNLTIDNKLSINLKFKTIQSHGIIFYGTNNDKSATVSLGLEQGVLVFRSSKYELNTDVTRFDDGEWHVVTATHNQRNLKLSIDDVYEFTSQDAPPPLQVNFGEIYFGGLPLGYRAVKGGLSNEAYFVGCIQDVTINNNVVNFATSTDKSNAILNSCPRDILDYDRDKVVLYYPDGSTQQFEEKFDVRLPNVYENEISREDESSPTATVAPTTTTTARTTASTSTTTTTSTTAKPDEITTTTTVETTTTRIYSETEKHTLCKLPAHPDYEVDFDSAGYRFGTKPSSYLEYESKPELTRTAYQFSLMFRTEKQNGVLFYASDSRHTNFIALYLKQGYINYIFNCGNNFIHQTSKMQYDDGDWHTVSFQRDGKKVFFKGDATDDEEKSQSLTQKCTNLFLSSPYFVGGVSDEDVENVALNLKFDKAQLTKNAFFGCIKDLRFNGNALALKEPPSDSILPCSDQIEKGVFFGKSGGYVKLREKFKVGTDTTISFDIKPRNLTGVLTSVHGKKSFFIVEMINGSIYFSVDSGDGPRVVVFEPDADRGLCDGNWHTVTVIKSRFILSINVDQFSSEPNVGNPDKHTIVDTTRPLFVGGHPHLAKIRGLKGRQPFQGCIRNFKINDVIENFTPQMTVGHVETGVCHLR